MSSQKSKSFTTFSFSWVAMVSIVPLAISMSYLYPFAFGATPFATVADAACQKLYTQQGPLIILPSNTQYTNLSRGHWSQTSWKQPSCIALPRSTSDVQILITSLVAENIPFAIRSGGHSPNPFDASIDAGVLIAMDNFNTVSYDDATKLASFGPGAKWNAVYSALDPYNLTVVGGRVLDVGVGGLTLGSGLSYLSDLYGLVCDNVVAFEVVLADGRLVEASSSKSPDLFWALKGGTNNFGMCESSLYTYTIDIIPIVTKITTTTYPINQIWSSIRTFSLSQTPEVMQALHDYQTTPNKDLYANLVLNVVASNDTIILTLVYLKPIPNPLVYAPFDKLTPATSTDVSITLHQLMGLFPIPAHPRWSWYSASFTPNAELYAQLSSLLATAPEVSTIAALQAGSLVGTVQPISSNVVSAGEKRGGNAMGLEAVNQTWFSVNAAWWNAEDDAVAYAALASLHNKVEVLIKSAEAGVRYIFMNDANIDQSVIASYGAANVARLIEVQKVYDPQSVFQKLVTGGQKLPIKLKEAEDLEIN
ncbi:hypothetical protein HYFRA_00012395 [Hymenoscyphus fraxineus]|uniref:FAD-binding PCMH-type domain-containing protein n=1 Tax=Hymenoscyphus fraxineus TaxID=746836 RepID=A0A9N9PUJ2_9HELO|nr:hypothetical protein HYFRA_00012395 [Hymenoscyphus fraxineus]